MNVSRSDSETNEETDTDGSMSESDNDTESSKMEILAIKTQYKVQFHSKKDKIYWLPEQYVPNKVIQDFRDREETSNIQIKGVKNDNGEIQYGGIKEDGTTFVIDQTNKWKYLNEIVKYMETKIVFKEE